MSDIDSINNYAQEWAEATGLVIAENDDKITISAVPKKGKKHVLLGTGDELREAVVDALVKAPTGVHSQKLFTLGALAEDPDTLFDAMSAIWGEDDEDEDEDEDEESESDDDEIEEDEDE